MTDPMTAPVLVLSWDLDAAVAVWNDWWLEQMTLPPSEPREPLEDMVGRAIAAAVGEIREPGEDGEVHCDHCLRRIRAIEDPEFDPYADERVGCTCRCHTTDSGDPIPCRCQRSSGRTR